VSELQHPDSRSFDDVAELYQRVRPSYPDEAIDWLVQRLGLDAGSTVLDLGAGTGKLTAAFARRVARVIAVEPGPAMLAQLRRAVPEAEAVLGAAEAIPIGDGAVDAVVCGQSFHWFRMDEALREIRRVLRPGGGLGLIWNVRDPDDPVQAEVTALLEPFVPPGRAALPTTVTDFVAENFGDVAEHVVGFEHELDADGLVGRISSISFVAAAPEPRRRELEQALRAFAAVRGGRVRFRYRAEAFAAFSAA
jgi:ubiquinone/menaquinone biosynthesis C-methylase UbiE